MTEATGSQDLPHQIDHRHADVSGGWLRAATFGAMDGLVSNTALIAGVGAGVRLSVPSATAFQHSCVSHRSATGGGVSVSASQNPQASTTSAIAAAVSSENAGLILV